MAYTKILLIGGAGNLGSLILKHLLSSPNEFQVTVLARESSTSQAKYPASVAVQTIADDYPLEGLTKAFTGQEVVISAISMAGMHLQFRFIDAAVAAKVRRYIPTEFGLSVLPDWLVELRPMFHIKHDVRDYLIAREGGDGKEDGLEWTSIVNNVFFEMGVVSGFFNLLWGQGEGSKKNKAVLVDGGEVEWVATTLDTVALAVVRSIERQDQTRNKILLIQDFRTSQKQVLDKIIEKTGRDAWEVENVKYDDWLEDAKTRARAGDERASGQLTFATVLLGSNWEGQPEYANDLLGLETKSIDEALEGALKSVL